MDLSAIYMFPIVNDSGAYDPTQPVKNWIRPMADGDDPEAPFIYRYALPDGSLHTTFVSNGAAAKANCFKTVAPGTVTNSAVIPVPLDLSKLPAGAAIVGTPFGATINVPQAVAGTTDDRVIRGINALLNAAHLPQV